MDDLDRLLRTLSHLNGGLNSSATESSTAEVYLKKTLDLVGKICNHVKDAEAAVSKRSTPRELELLHAAKATEAAARAANAAADAADAATVAATVSEGPVAGRAVTAALRAAGAAYRAATSARFAAVAAESLPAGAYLRYDGEIAGSLIEEREQLRKLYQFLFQDQNLQLPTTLFLQLSPFGQAVIQETVVLEWDKLLEFLKDIQNLGTEDPLGNLFKVISENSRRLKAFVRQYVIESPAFRDSAVLRRMSGNEAAFDLGLARDAELRARNIEKLPALFAGKGGDEEEIETLSGKVGQDDADNFLTFPGKMNDLPIKPLIDTGGGCNIVKAGWLRDHNIPVIPDPSRFMTLLMADGSKSEKCPSIDVKWSFDGRAKRWTDVEFVVVEGYEYDALIGLPFLKHTETIHNSEGKLVFPEFNKLHARKDAIPTYPVKGSKVGK
ncbi:uncharacterized protein DFL_000465 [Arthrobotrys flagrans]|uniref:Uncharacterized protein n=1 Tax=Arthrobotrys flagrans TaxID=97331 RepID=A0A437AED7_ARTFL|nr:hypothetical protein DFL_000465 [Arthrobotrys flagrans]